QPAARDRCPHLRAARAHGPHPGGPHPGAALPVRRRGRATARRPGTPMSLRTASLTLAAVLAAGTLAGCAPLLIGGAAVGTVMVAQDRRTSGAQIDDEAIELRSASRLREAFGKTAHINVNSYNRQVLLTGEVPNEA